VGRNEIYDGFKADKIHELFPTLKSIWIPGVTFWFESDHSDMPKSTASFRLERHRHFTGSQSLSVVVNALQRHRETPEELYIRVQGEKKEVLQSPIKIPRIYEDSRSLDGLDCTNITLVWTSRNFFSMF
jgi:hypothetical protein